jgi:hypothetical protein
MWQQRDAEEHGTRNRQREWKQKKIFSTGSLMPLDLMRHFMV